MPLRWGFKSTRVPEVIYSEGSKEMSIPTNALGQIGYPTLTPTEHVTTQYEKDWKGKKEVELRTFHLFPHLVGPGTSFPGIGSLPPRCSLFRGLRNYNSW